MAQTVVEISITYDFT